MIVLGGVTLNANLIWVDRDSYSAVAQQFSRTLGGRPVLWSQQAIKGQPITLQATEDQGWFTKEQKDSVLSMANQAGIPFALQIGAANFFVVFRHHESPATDFQPLIPRAVDLVGDYFTGEIRLMTV